MTKLGALIIGVILGGAIIYSAPLVMQRLGGGDYMSHMAEHHGQHGGNGMMHDEMNMPMLNGKNTTQDEVDDLRALFTNHLDITRSVEMLPNGIRTVTETENAALRDALVSHVSVMITRVDAGDDPEIPIQSLMLTPIFEGGNTITTEINPTEMGVEVIQTSSDPKVVEALQKHANEVSDLAARGMDAVHEQMMSRSH